MATATVPTALPGELQNLIDSRLDTIDRMLVGQVPRADRLAIVREVEAQIHDLLAERGPADLDRRDILDVLARLDPPEAYLGDEARLEGASIVPRATLAPGPRSQARTQRQLYGKTGGILGIIALTLTLLGGFCIPLAFLIGSDVTLVGSFAPIGIGLILAILGLVFSAVDRLAGRWSVIGFVTSAIAMTSGGICAGVVVYLMFFS